MQNNIVYNEVLNNAIASVEFEGYEIQEFQKKSCLEFVNGKINKDDFIKLMLERYNV